MSSSETSVMSDNDEEGTDYIQAEAQDITNNLKTSSHFMKKNVHQSQVTNPPVKRARLSGVSSNVDLQDPQPSTSTVKSAHELIADEESVPSPTRIIEDIDGLNFDIPFEPIPQKNPNFRLRAGASKQALKESKESTKETREVLSELKNEKISNAFNLMSPAVRFENCIINSINIYTKNNDDLS
ncbi:hypothetical protein KQX54_012070 [Cotesia glomerata]|uniref:Uncharacterized protein n=1 Tax=Cotesia glomerata TaxID=32391 RepID=A0AAV7IJD5_COTGL|nr:hypothetical protein KQX54_012070 [Cotesia glomerata]